MDELQVRFTACTDGECERKVRNEYRQQEKVAGEKLLSMYKSGALTSDDFNLLVTDYARSMLAGAKEGQLDSDYRGFLGDIYSQTGIDWTPMGVIGNPYVAAIKGSQQIAKWKSQGLSDEKIHDLALKNDVISSTLSPVDVNGVMNLLDNGASGQDVIKFASGLAFNKVVGSQQISAKAKDVQIWSETKKKQPVSNTYGHWDKHKSEFPEYHNSKQYVEAAHSFVNNPPPGTLTRIRSNGETVYYNPSTNTFAVKRVDGAPRTMFKPDPADHGFKTNLDYFNAQ